MLQTQLALKRLFVAKNPEVDKPDGTRGPLNPNLAVGTEVHYPAPAGSIVAMNNQTGAIMAMASYPTFDNRWFSADVPEEKFAQIFPTTEADGSPLDPDKAALTNRAIQGQYNVGSTFKPFTAYAALATGRLSGATIFNDQGTYQLSNASIKEDRCAAGVRCVFRNSTCPPDNTPCRYGSVNVESALAVSSDAFFYHLGEEFFLTPGTQLQDQVRLFGFGAKTGIDLPFEFAGRVPTNELKKELLDRGVLAEGESANMQPGDVLLLAIGQGLLAATPLQLTVGYSVFGNGGTVVTPHVVQAILAPETPDSDVPGVADLTQATVTQQITPPGRAMSMPPAVLDPINKGLRRNITGPGTAAHSTTAQELFADYPPTAIQVAGKTGTAQGAGSYPWYDSSAFSAYSVQPELPITVTSYLEKAGYGSVGAAPVVKCMFEAISGLIPLDPVEISEPLDTTSKVAAASLPTRVRRLHEEHQRQHDHARRGDRRQGLTGRMGLSVLQRKPDSGLGNIRASHSDPSRNIDWVLLTTQIALTVAGCFVVYSATRVRTADPYTFVTRQVIFAIVAAVVMVVVMVFDYEWWKERARTLYVLTVIVLFGIALYSRTSGTTTLAVDVGPIQIQPAEFAKFTVLLAMCAYLSEDRTPGEGVSYPRFMGSLIIVGIPAALIIVQPDLGTGSVLIAMTMGVLLVAGAKARYIVTISALSILTVAAAYFARLVNDYQLARIRVFFDEDNPALRADVYQVDNAVKAVGTGGVFGKGWLQGPLTNGRDIPVIWADFPFAAVGEQFGLVGCAILLFGFAVVLVRIWRIAHLSRDMFGTYLCAGVFTMMLWQVFQNVGMTIKIMPVTGLPMPFISYGGSSLITWFALLGLVQSVHMRRMR